MMATHMHYHNETYDFVQRALAVGEAEAVGIGMLAGTYESRVGTVRDRLPRSHPWSGPVEAALRGLKAEDTLGRFRMLQTPWNTHMQTAPAEWAAGLKEVALSGTPAEALKAAQPLERLPGAGEFQLTQLVHLLHPSWFAITNRESAWFWERLGFSVGGLANLENISSRYRDLVEEHEINFSILEELFSVDPSGS